MVNWSSRPHWMLLDILDLFIEVIGLLAQQSAVGILLPFLAAKPLWLIWEQICEISLSCALKWGSIGIYALFYSYRWDVKIDSLCLFSKFFIYRYIYIIILFYIYIVFCLVNQCNNCCIRNIQQMDITAFIYNKVGIQKVSWKWDKAQRSSLKGQLNLIHIPSITFYHLISPLCGSLVNIGGKQNYWSCKG